MPSLRLAKVTMSTRISLSREEPQWISSFTLQEPEMVCLNYKVYRVIQRAACATSFEHCQLKVLRSFLYYSGKRWMKEAQLELAMWTVCFRSVSSFLTRGRTLRQQNILVTILGSCRDAEPVYPKHETDERLVPPKLRKYGGTSRNESKLYLL